MLFGILCLVATGIIWVIPGAIVSHSAKKGLSLDFIQGMTQMIPVVTRQRIPNSMKKSPCDDFLKHEAKDTTHLLFFNFFRQDFFTF